MRARHPPARVLVRRAPHVVVYWDDDGLVIENYRTELLWKTMRRNPYIVAGLKRAGFTGGWLETVGAGGRFATGPERVQHKGHESLSRSVSN